MHVRALPTSAALLLLGLAPALAQRAPAPLADEGPHPRPALEWSLLQWRGRHGDGWRAALDRETGYAEMLYGASARPPYQPRADAEWFAVAEGYLREARGLHGLAVESLRPESLQLLPLALAESTDKMVVVFRQELAGLAVEHGSVQVLLALDGSLLAWQTRALPSWIEAPELAPRLAAGDALARAAADFLARTELAHSEASEPRLHVAQVLTQGVRRGRLAWSIDLYWRDGAVQPLGTRYEIDALDGSVLASHELVHQWDVGGTVQTMATPGVAPDTGGNPETAQAMVRARVTSSAGTVFTDANGFFNYPGVNGPLNVTVEYVGTFNDVRNQAGGDYTLTVSAATGTGNSILMNPSPTEFTTAQANAYVGVNQLRDWVRAVDPSDAHADFLAISNVNLNSTCNAYYDGVSVNFFRVGGGCVNTAYSTVVAHEMGHWYNDRYNTFNGSDGMGEGNADVWAMYLYDVPIVGLDFCGSGCHVRDGNNTRQFCGDTNPGCYGEVHADGEVWMGAAWKVRRNLNSSLGNTLGDQVADSLFLAWMNGYDQTQIRSIIEVQWLTLDDDNGNIGDGTPHYAEIDSAFREQGFPGYDLPLVLYSGVTDLPDTQDELGPYVVDATIVAGIHPPIAGATLRWRLDGGAFQDVAMQHLSGDLWRAAIPGQNSPAEVDYYLTASDSQGNSATYPSLAPGELLGFSIGTLSTFFFNDFEGATNEGWAAGDTGDNATTGIWVRVDPNGTAAQPEDDHTAPPGVMAWVTGQGSVGGSLGENDVDNGTTTLRSPVFDASGLVSPKIRYWRWYSNNTGAEPNADTFRVDVSNNGGSSWTTVEIVGPSGPEASGGWYEHVFRIADFVVPTATMRMRFVASDLAGGSVVEAALDDVQGTDLGPSFQDCNQNGVDDSIDIQSGASLDCDQNGVPDECQPDCDGDGIPDACEADCDQNGTPDDCESLADCNANGIPDVCESFADCNSNGIPDECEADCDADGIPDDCETDCNANGIPDDCENLADCNGNGIPDVCESFADCNSNGIPDECEADCDADGIPDDCETDCNANGVPDDCESLADCNGNGIPDVCESFADCNSNGIPDECEADCDADGIPDDCETDCNANGVPDDCENLADCNGNGIPDVCESFADCNSNGIPDECEADCDADGIPDDCETDCNANGVPDDCENLADCNANGIPDVCESFADCNSNGIPDECEADCDADGIPDDCETDCNANGVPDDCENLADCNANGIPDVCESFADCNSNGIPDECDIASGTSQDANGNGIPDECECSATHYCQTSSNSVGSGALMDHQGSLSIGANDLVLRATGLPHGQFGIFYYGPNQIDVAFGNGHRCVGGQIFRLPIRLSDGQGELLYAVDYGALPLGGDIAAGDLWNFQCWYRDPQGGGANFNLSDGLAIRFCP